MPNRDEQNRNVGKLREKVAALVKRSAEKCEEMRGIQARIEELGARLSKAVDEPGAPKKPLKDSRQRDQNK